MGEGETLPKENTSKAWLERADKKRKAFMDYHSERTMGIGPVKRPQPLSDDYSRILSQKEMEARDTGMRLKREENARKTARTSSRDSGRR